MTTNKIYPIIKKLINDDTEAKLITQSLLAEINNFKVKPGTTKKKYFIVAFAGRSNSGKSTCQQFAKVLLKHDFKIHSCNFADPLKIICNNVFKDKMPYSAFYGKQSEKLDKNPDYYNLSGRILMQIIGTDIIRAFFGENFWIDCLFARAPEDVNTLIIGDVRFKNEVDFIRKEGGVIIKVICNVVTDSKGKVIKGKTPPKHAPISHPSEDTDNLYYDHLIENTKTQFTKLKESVKKVLDACEYENDNMKKLLDGDPL